MSKYIEGVQHSPSEIGCIESPNSSKPRFQETGSWISLRSLEVENGIVSQQGLSFLSMQTVCFRIWTKTVETLVRLSFFVCVPDKILKVWDTIRVNVQIMTEFSFLSSYPMKLRKSRSGI